MMAGVTRESANLPGYVVCAALPKCGKNCCKDHIKVRLFPSLRILVVAT
jgi:hypothetical protein